MKMTAHASAIATPAVVEFARRIQRKRASLSSNPLIETIAATSTGKSILQSLGLRKLEITVGPEITLAKMLKEWRELDAPYAWMNFHMSGRKSSDEKHVEKLKELNSRIAMLEYRVFGKNISNNYPSFERLEDWLRWRLILTHPDYDCDKIGNGWTDDLFFFAVEDSRLTFGTPLTK